MDRCVPDPGPYINLRIEVLTEVLAQTQDWYIQSGHRGLKVWVDLKEHIPGYLP